MLQLNNLNKVFEPEAISRNEVRLKSQTSKESQMEKVFAIAIIMFVLLSLIACSSTGNKSSTFLSNKNLIGVWETEITYDTTIVAVDFVFFDNGTCCKYEYTKNNNQDISNIRNLVTGSYSVYDDIIMLVGSHNDVNSDIYKFNINGNMLKISGLTPSESSREYKKIK